MSSIDERIVEMRFNNGQFQAGVSQTLSALKNLESGLKLDNVGANLETVASKFNVFGAIGFSAIQKLTNVAIDSGAKIYSAVVDPIIKGGERRSQNFAQAEFQLKGLGVTGEKLTKVMDAASYAVDGTAYGLDQAAVAASSFVASNVPIDQLGFSLRGISGVAAMTGRDFGDISQIFTTVAGNGRLMASELNRIGASGVNAAAALAKSLGVTETEVRKMTSEGKINFEMFAKAMDDSFGEQATKANDLYSGSLSNLRSALARIGEPIADGKFEKLRLIFNALTPVINNVKNAMMPLLNMWKSYQIGAGKALATTIENLGKTTFSLENLSPGFKALANAFQTVLTIMAKFKFIAKDVWKNAFPNKSSFNLLTFIGNTIKKVVDGFERATWIFTAFRLVLTVVLNVFSLVGKVLSSVGKIVWSILEVFFELGMAIWDIIKPLFGISDAVDGTSDGLQSFFDLLKMGIDKVVPVIIDWLHGLRDAIKSLREGGSSGVDWVDKLYKTLMNLRDGVMVSLPKIIENVKNSIKDFFSQDIGSMAKTVAGWFVGAKIKVSDLIEGVDPKSIWETITAPFQTAFENLSPITGSILDLITTFFNKIVEYVSNMNSDDWATMFSFAGIITAVIGITKVLKKFGNIADSFSGMMASVGGAFDNLGSYFKTLKADVNTNIALKIAIAIGIIAGSIWLLAQLDTGKAWSAAGMIGAIFVLLAGSMILLDKFVDEKSTAKLAGVGVAMALMAVGVLILAKAVEAFAAIDPDKIAQGMITMALSLALLVAAMTRIGKVAGDGKLVSAAFAMGLLASSMYIMASVIKIMGSMNPDTLAQGMISMALSMALLAGMSQILAKAGKNMLAASVGLLAIGFALYLVAGAIKIFAMMGDDTFVQGGLRIAMVLGALVVVGLLLGKAGASFATAAVGVLAIAASLVIISFAFLLLAGLDMEQIITGLIALGGAMIILVVAAMAMQGTIVGAVAMIFLAGAMVIMATALLILAQADMEGIGQAFLILVGAILLLGVAAAIFQVFAVGALVFAAVLLAIGVAALLVGVAIALVVASIMLLGPAGASASVGLDLLAMAVERNAVSMGTIAIMGAALLAFGIGAGIAGAGAIMLGVGLLILSVGLILIAVVGPIGAMALEMLMNKIAALIPQAAMMAVVSAALLAFGAATIVASVGILLLAVGLLMLAPALIMVAMAGRLIGPAFGMIAKGVEKLAPYAGKLMALGVAFLILAPGLVAVGAGAMMAGPGMLALGVGLAMVIPLSKMAGPAFERLVSALKPIIPQGPMLMILGAAFSIMGVGLGLMAASTLMVSVGLLAAVLAMTKMQTTAPALMIALNMLAASAPASSATIVSAFRSMSTGITSASSGITSAVTSMMQSMGASIIGGGAIIVSAMTMIVMMMVTTLLIGSVLVGPASNRIVQTIVKTLMSGVPTLRPLGVLFIATFIMGMLSQLGRVNSTANTLAKSVPRAMKSQTSSARSSGSSVGLAFANGVRSASSAASNAGRSVGSSVISGMRSAISTAGSSAYSSGYTIGYQIAQGMSQGMLNSQYLVVSAAQSLANAVPEKIRKLLGISSPSKVAYKLFGWFVMGGKNALDDGVSDIEKSSSDIADAMVGNIEDSLKTLASIANKELPEDINMSPVIRPVLDLSEVKSGAKTIDELFTNSSIYTDGTSKSARAVAVMERNKSKDSRNTDDSSSRVVNEYTINQYNNSPKALTNAEIYRNTKNLMSQVANKKTQPKK